MTVSDFLAVFFRLYVRSVMFVGLPCHDFFFFSFSFPELLLGTIKVHPFVTSACIIQI